MFLSFRHSYASLWTGSEFIEEPAKREKIQMFQSMDSSECQNDGKGNGYSIIAEYKKQNGLPIYDPVRENELLKRYSEKVDFDIFPINQAIMDESKRLQ